MAKSRSKPESQTAPETAQTAVSAASSPPPARGPRRIVWLHVLTVVSITILIGAEVFGAAFAASWALTTLFEVGEVGATVLQVVFVACGIAIMVQFVRSAHKIEPFTARA